MNLSKSCIGVAALAGLLGAAGPTSDVQAADPNLLTFTTKTQTCTLKGGSCTILPAVTYGIVGTTNNPNCCVSFTTCKFTAGDTTNMGPQKIDGLLNNTNPAEIDGQGPFSFNKAGDYSATLTVNCAIGFLAWSTEQTTTLQFRVNPGS